MICRFCGGQVTWRGPITALTHTQCHDFGEQNCQLVDDEQQDEPKPVKATHRPDCLCNECEQRRIPTSRAEYNHQKRGRDPFEIERGIRRAEQEYEARLFRDRG